MSKIALIPARGGSKRISKKNIRDFLGKPIIAYAIEKALSSNLFDDVMVSTDDPEIAKIAVLYGANVPFMRSAANSDDHATTFAVIREVYETYLIQGISHDQICCIYPCTPLFPAESLFKGLELLIGKQYDSVLPVVAYSTNIQRALKITEGKTSFFNPEFALTRSQDLEKAYYDPGQFYWINCEQAIKKGSILTDNSGSIIMDEMHVQDIDNLNDWKLAELKYKMLDIANQ